MGYVTRSLFLWDRTVKAATQVEALKCGVKECVAEWALSACGLYVSAALHKVSSFVASVMLSGEREGEKQFENQELPTNSLRLIPPVSPEISRQGIFGVFQLVCLSVCMCECLCVGWEFLFTKLKTLGKKKKFCFLWKHSFTSVSLHQLSLSSPIWPPTPPPQVISTDSVFTSIFFVIVCCLIIINVIMSISLLHLLHTVLLDSPWFNKPIVLE